MRRTVIAPALLALALGATVHPAPATADDAEVAAKVSLFEYNASAFAKRVANDEWDQVGYTVTNMADALAAIQKLDPKRDVAALAKRLADARAALEAHQRAVAKAADERQRLERIERAHHIAIGTVRDLPRIESADPNEPYAPQQFKDLVASLAELAEVADECTKEGLTAAPCDLAADRAALAQHVLDRAVASDVAAAVATLRRESDMLASDGELGDLGVAALDLDGMRAAWLARYAALGAMASAPLDPSKLEPVIEAAKALVARIPAAAKKSRMPAGMGAAPASVVADTKVTFPKLKVRKVVMGRAWDVETNDFRVPINRTAHGAALLQQAGEPYCRVVPFLVTQPYVGGKWGTAHVDNFDGGYLVSACK